MFIHKMAANEFRAFSEEAVQDPIQFNDFIKRQKNDLKKHKMNNFSLKLSII